MSIGDSVLVNVGCFLLAAGLYVLYLACFRVRAELTSLSQLHGLVANPDNQPAILSEIGQLPLRIGAFPLIARRSKTLFISYMHDSPWSTRLARLIWQCASDQGMDVYLDSSSVPSGSLWRQHLLRGLSESANFIAVLDGEVSSASWALAESAYVVLLRKTIGKPRILLVARDIGKLREGPFGALYSELLQASSGHGVPGAALRESKEALSARNILQEMEAIPRMCLLM